ncbi:MAG: hypothetical protein CMF69_02290 [Magnetovibrio sp.]|nr:hypothetical protein [Magnetovibrio sp.]|tara:strand:+ start:147 stop:974 length:828 start_codon:yes stop_codon:yes gene_type:complete
MKDNLIIGVAGCGAMGLPMAQKLRHAGFTVWGYDVRPAIEFMDFAPRMIEDPGEFASTINTLISVVRDQRQNFDLLFDEQAIMNVENPPKTIVISSTISPRCLTKIAKRLPPESALVDAAMSGAPSRAKAGTLTFMVGGEKKVVEDLLALFRAMGDKIHQLGSTGMGLKCKVINNFVAITGFAAVRKALIAADALSLPRERLLEVMSTSSGSTWYGDNIDSISWAKEGYSAANTIGILEKDMLSFLDAMRGHSDIEFDNLTDSVLDIVRASESIE